MDVLGASIEAGPGRKMSKVKCSQNGYGAFTAVCALSMVAANGEEIAWAANEMLNAQIPSFLPPSSLIYLFHPFSIPVAVSICIWLVIRRH